MASQWSVLGGCMSLRPSVWPDPGKEPSEEAGRAEPGASSWDPAQEIATLARTLANAGGGALSVDLAIDLILNETVEQARKATRADGAAIALARDGEMICRATTGNAPDLGTPVDTASGLSAACLKTATVQESSDTEVDSRIDGEACRQLHVRSMLLVPVLQDGSACGILEVFSAQPHNFGQDDVKTLQSLASKIVEARKTAEMGMAEKSPASEAKSMPDNPTDVPSPKIVASADSAEASEPAPNALSPETGAKNEVLTSALMALVIAAAVLLGVVIGVRQMAKRGSHVSDALSARKLPVQSGSTPVAVAPAQSNPTAPAAPTRAGVRPPPGGLIVTQHGKVIYRLGPSGDLSSATGTAKPPTRLVHRVEPEYPEAAKSQHIEGAVVLEAHVLGDGTVGNVAVLEGHPLLAEAATQAVRQWKYQPYFVDGRPVERQERITVKFSLPSS